MAKEDLKCGDKPSRIVVKRCIDPKPAAVDRNNVNGADSPSLPPQMQTNPSQHTDSPQRLAMKAQALQHLNHASSTNHFDHIPDIDHIRMQDPDATPLPMGNQCFLCKRDLTFTPQGPVLQPITPPAAAVLPCGHAFHDHCLQNITPQDEAKNPPCIPCVLGES